MSVIRKIRVNLQIIKGRVMRRFGRAAGNRRVENEGRGNQVVGQLKLIRENAKGVFKR